MDEKQIPAEKAALRQRFAAYRAGLSAEEWARRSARIVARVQRLPEIRAARAVHCYWPAAAQREVDVRPLVERLHERGRTVAMPVVTSFEAGRPAMTARRFAGRAALRTNRWGLAEPEGTEVVPPRALDAVVVPAFGAGRGGGHRIGHGRGFYDAFLADVDAPAVCPVYDACLAEAVPAEAHDVAMDVLVTETRTLRIDP